MYETVCVCLSPDPVVVHEDVLQSVKHGKAVYLPNLIVGEINCVKLILQEIHTSIKSAQAVHIHLFISCQISLHISPLLDLVLSIINITDINKKAENGLNKALC